MNTFETYKLLVSCLSLGHGVSANDLQKLIDQNEPDWPALAYIANAQLVLPAFYGQMKRHGMLANVPEEFVVELQKIYELNVLRNKRLKEQALEIVQVLNANQIKPVFLKGTANVFDQLYDGDGERYVGDIDFLVADHEFRKTADLLEGMGYEYENDELRPLEDHMMKHFPRMFRQGSDFDVEIHRIPVNESYSKALNYDIIMAEAKVIQIEGAQFYVCSDRHKLYLNFIHDQLSNGGSRYAFVNLRGVFDTLCLSERINVADAFFEWPFFKRKTNNYRYVVNQISGISQPFDARKTISARSFLRRIKANVSTGLWYKLNKLFVYFFIRLEGYWRAMYKAVSSRSYRRYVWRCISNPAWYKSHFQSWTLKN